MSDDAVEREKFAFEREKWCETLAIEKKKLRLEKKGRWISTLGTVVPLLVVALTIYGNTEAQKVQSKADFDLKAAEVVLTPKSVAESQNRAEGLVALLPDRFSADFPHRLAALRQRLDRPEVDKRALLDLLAGVPKDRRKEILALWLAFYPQDRDQIPEGVFKLLGTRKQ